MVIGEDNQEYLLPSMFGTKHRAPDELSFEIDSLDGRVSRLEELVAERSLSGIAIGNWPPGRKH